MNLKDKSIEIIKQNQHTSGAYVASPNFDNYKYSWLRDGSFIAYSMNVVGEHESAEKFYCWVNNTLEKNHDKYINLMEKNRIGLKLEVKDFLPCRYTLQGSETNDDWPNFQLDGYGTWLWGLTEHIKFTQNFGLLEKFEKSINATIDYLVTFWHLPNSDCWEENQDKIHPSTLACIYGGLNSINEFLNDDKITRTIEEIRVFLLKEAIRDNRFVKYIGSESIDTSLLWLTVPFNVFTQESIYVKNTVKIIEEKLLHEGGVHRFPEDTYYGGGEWLLLSSWLGWNYTQAKQKDKAKAMLSWVESQVDDNGYMTEQVLHHVNNEKYVDKWLKQWGPVASPLLWSHAMYLILLENIKKS